MGQSSPSITILVPLWFFITSLVFFYLRVRFFKEIQDWILKSEGIGKWILRFSLDRLIEDLSDHGASKEPKNPFWKRILRFL